MADDLPTPTPAELAANPKALEFARKLAALRGRSCPELADEFESAALVGLMEAATTFDPRRDIPFFTYAYLRISGAVLDCQRSWMPRGYRGTSRGKVPRVDSISTADEIDWPADVDPVDTAVAYHDELAAYARRLPTSRHRRVLRLYYGHAACATMRSVGREIGLTEARISVIHLEAIALLRQAYAVEGG